MNDATSTVQSLRSIVEKFVHERDWEPFHTPKNLASCIAIETAELMEHFQWLTPEQSMEVISDKEKLHEIEEEMADVLAYILALTNVLGVDLASALAAKMRKNAVKYPPPAS